MRKIHIDEIEKHAPPWESMGKIYSKITQELIDELKDRGWTRPFDEQGVESLVNHVKNCVIIFYKGKRLTRGTKEWARDNEYTEVEIVGLSSKTETKPFNRWDYVDLD